MAGEHLRVQVEQLRLVVGVVRVLVLVAVGVVVCRVRGRVVHTATLSGPAAYGPAVPRLGKEEAGRAAGRARSGRREAVGRKR